MNQAFEHLLVRAESLIAETLRLEETRFRTTLARGLSILDGTCSLHHRRLARFGALPVPTSNSCATHQETIVGGVPDDCDSCTIAVRPHR